MGRLLRAALLAVVLPTAAGLPAAAQERPSILIVDRERALRDSAPAARLAEATRQERLTLRAELDALRDALEAEEAEIAAMRDVASKEAFDARVRAFDQRVREARRDSAAKGEALENRLAAARRDLAAQLGPVLEALLAEHDALLIIDAGAALAARAGADVTDEAIRRFNESAQLPEGFGSAAKDE